MKPMTIIIATAIVCGAGAILLETEAKKATIRPGPGASKFITVHSSDAVTLPSITQ